MPEFQADISDTTWEWNAAGEHAQAWFQALLEHQMHAEVTQFEALHGHSQPPHGYRSPEPAASGFNLEDWLRNQRSGHMASALAVLTENDSVHGVTCPPPLPNGLTLRGDIAPYIPEAKDVDGAHPTSLASLLPFPELSLDEVVLSRAATAALAPEPVRQLACALLVMATVAAARRQHDLTTRSVCP